MPFLQMCQKSLVTTLSAGTLEDTFLSASTAGSLLVLVTHDYTNGSNVYDNNGTVFTQIYRHQKGYGYLTMYYGVNAAAKIGHKVSFQSATNFLSGAFVSMQCIEFSGCFALPYDTYFQTSGTATSVGLSCAKAAMDRVMVAAGITTSGVGGVPQVITWNATTLGAGFIPSNTIMPGAYTGVAYMTAMGSWSPINPLGFSFPVSGSYGLLVASFKGPFDAGSSLVCEVSGCWKHRDTAIGVSSDSSDLPTYGQLWPLKL